MNLTIVNGYTGTALYKDGVYINQYPNFSPVILQSLFRDVGVTTEIFNCSQPSFWQEFNHIFPTSLDTIKGAYREFRRKELQNGLEYHLNVAKEIEGSLKELDIPELDTSKVEDLEKKESA